MSQSQAGTTQQKVITSFIVLVVIAALVVGIDASKKKDTQAVATASTSSNTASSSAATTSGSYKDGTYMADGSYGSPGGTQTIGVTVTLAAGKITDSSVTSTADGVAQYYQSSFIKGFKELVVGKSINDVKLSRVSGSSLTSKGYNAALQKIKDQAQS